MSENQPPRTFEHASTHPFHNSTQSSPDSISPLTGAAQQPQPDIPLTTLPPPPTYAGIPSQRRNEGNEDLEAALPPSGNPHAGPLEDEPLPGYKEQDMAEPLPPYMTRVRGVVRGQQPISAAVPVMEKRTGRFVVLFFILAVLIIIGVGVGVRVAANNSNNNNNNTI